MFIFENEGEKYPSLSLCDLIDSGLDTWSPKVLEGGDLGEDQDSGDLGLNALIFFISVRCDRLKTYIEKIQCEQSERTKVNGHTYLLRVSDYSTSNLPLRLSFVTVEMLCQN